MSGFSHGATASTLQGAIETFHQACPAARHQASATASTLQGAIETALLVMPKATCIKCATASTLQGAIDQAFGTDTTSTWRPQKAVA